ncbi:MAG: non-homologous end-joining DNA ligase [Acidimicrobiales bacterium]
MAASPSTMVQAGDVEVRVTNPDKVFFSKHGQTKLDLVEYYLAVADPIMDAIGGRPQLLQRFPDGASGKSFYQKRVPKGAPEWLQTTTVSTPNGTTSNAMVAADVAHLVWAVNLGCLGFHGWPFLAANPAFTDELRIDLDPTPGTTFDDVRRAAFDTRELLAELGVNSYVKTTGSKGLHVFSRLEHEWDSYQVRGGAVALARELERRHPDRLTAAWWKEERGQRVFVDFNQNAPHKTVFGAWSVRSRVGAQVSTPLSWDALEQAHPNDLTMDTVVARFDELGDPWSDIADEPQSINRLLDMHNNDLNRGLGDAPWPPVYPKMPLEPPRVAPSRAKK